MKGAFLASANLQIFDVVKKVLVGLGGTYYPEDGAVQLCDELGNLFTVYENAEPVYEYRDGPLVGASEAPVPDMHNKIGLAVECRNERQFTLLAKMIAQASANRVWVIDGNGIVWSAMEVDAARVCL